MAVKNELNEIIYFHRKQSKMSRKELAALANVGKTVIYDLEKGRTTVRFSTILAIMEVLNITIEFKSPLIETYEKSTSKNA